MRRSAVVLTVTSLALGAAGTTAASSVPPGGSTPPTGGDSYDIGDGRMMHILCTGEGSPTIVLDGGIPDVSESFADVQDALDDTHRVCRFDRPGYGASDPGPLPRTAAANAADLHALLGAAGEEAPLLLAGHSFGGINAIVYAGQYPDEVAGVALLDSSNPRQMEELAAVPEVLTAQDREIDAASAAMPAAAIEYESFADSLADAAEVTTLGDTPLVVVARGKPLTEVVSPDVLEAMGISPDSAERFETIWRGLQEDFLNLSTDSRLVIADDAGHLVYIDQPEVVIDAILSIA